VEEPRHRQDHPHEEEEREVAHVQRKQIPCSNVVEDGGIILIPIGGNDALELVDTLLVVPAR
jgi:hypothetical protein